jgi:hypothetical protein
MGFLELGCLSFIDEPLFGQGGRVEVPVENGVTGLVVLRIEDRVGFGVGENAGIWGELPDGLHLLYTI